MSEKKPNGQLVKYPSSLKDEEITSVEVCASGNIIKNVKSVIVPHTNGLRGIPAAAAAGIVAGEAEAELEVLSSITESQQKQIVSFLDRVPCTVTKSTSDYILDIAVTLHSANHTVYARTAQYHTGLCLIQVDGKTIFEAPIAPIQIGIDLWFDMPIMETGLYACCLELLKNLRRSGHALPSTAFRPSTN